MNAITTPITTWTIAPRGADAAPLPTPEVTPEMYYGLTGDVMREAADGTEVHPAAAGIVFMNFAGTALGRTRFVRIGNERNHARLYDALVGRSGSGGKGMAAGITRRIRMACEAGADPRHPVTGHFHDGGLSSREGLAWVIRDASDIDGKDGAPVDPGVNDKRLFVVEDEFANVLAQTRREGNTLSSALRTAWDGGDLAPLTKSNRTRATAPHVGIHACITPAELALCLEQRELTNGFASRFLYVWAERQGAIPFPRTSPDEVIEGFADELKQSIAFAEFGGAVGSDQGARDLFAKFYRKHRRGLGRPARVRSLLERLPPYAWRLALIFALLDRADVITAAHMRSALAWLDYCAASVDRIFSDEAAQEDAEEAGALAKHIVEVIAAAGGEMNREPLREALGKPSADVLDAALEQAETGGYLTIRSTPRAGGGRPTRTYKLQSREPRLLPVTPKENT